MSRFTDFDRVVISMMRDFGGVGTLRVISGEQYVDGEVTKTVKDYEVNVVLLDYPQVGAGDKQNFNTLILEGDKQCYVQPRDKQAYYLDQPELKANRDTVLIGGIEWKIQNFKDLNTSGNDSVLLDLHLRK
jgi:hypothetical protein